jgi:diguanylate cyclase (GGDEF)-like protein
MTEPLKSEKPPICPPGPFEIIRAGRLMTALLFLILTLMTGCSGSAPERTSPELQAKNGVLDLSSVDLSRTGPLPLGGEWEFVFGRHVSPEEMKEAARTGESAMIKVPGTWKGFSWKGTTLGGTGIATYRLTVLTEGAPSQPLALLIPGWETAYTLFINKKEALTIGVPGQTKDETVSAWIPRIVLVEAGEGVLELVVQISNFSHPRGGPAMMPLIGTAEAVRDTREKGIAFKLFSFGSLFMIALYHAAIFLMRRKEKSDLYFALFSFLMALRALVINEQALVLFLPAIPWHLHIRITYLTFALSSAAITLFLDSLYREDMSRIFTRILTGTGLIYSGLIVLTPPLFFAALILPFQILIMAGALYFLYVLVITTLRKREGALLFLAAFLVFFTCIVNDILFHYQLTSTGYIAPFGFLVFIFLKSLVLAKRYDATFSKVEELFVEKTKLEGTALTLKNLTYLDPLTGTANRRRFDEYLEQSWRQALRTEKAVALIILDIDFFKNFNDLYGHPRGDEALKMVAGAIQNCVHRPSDLAARYGGEEFAVLLPDTGLEGALAVAETIRIKVETLGIPAADRSVAPSVTISLGCASLRPQQDTDPTELVSRADEALYRAKSGGRNRVETD